jgi:cytochrome c oxidase subunit 4
MRDVLPPLSLVLTWIALLLLVATTLTLAYVPLGSFNIVVAMAVSVTKTALVVILFMKLPRSSPLTWAAAGTGLFWLAILFALASTDYLTRLVVPT